WCRFASYFARCSAELGMFCSLDLNPHGLARVEIRRQLLRRGCGQECHGAEQAPLDVRCCELSQLVAQLEIVGLAGCHKVETGLSVAERNVRLRVLRPVL